jgi:hypothetical protein
MADEDVLAVELQRASVSPEAPAVPVYHFVITRVGNEFLLEPGYVDLAELKIAIDQARLLGGQGPVRVPLYIREKYLCTQDALVQLRTAADEILSRLPEQRSSGGKL